MKRIIYLLHVVATVTLIGWSVQGLAQSEPDASPPQVVVTNFQGNRAYLEIRANNLQDAINELYYLSVGAANSGWSTILENGSNPGMDVNYSGYDILGVGSFGADGTLSADSLILMKDGVVQGSLTLQSGLHVDSIFALDEDVVLDLEGSGLLKVDGKGLFTDSLTVNGHAVIDGTLFADSIAVTDVINGRVSSLSNHDTDALSEGTTNLYFTESRAQDAFTAGTGVTLDEGEISIGQAVGTTDDVTFDDIAAYSLTVDGATTLNSTLDVSGQADLHNNVNVDLDLNVDGATSLNSTLDVSGQADFHDDVNVDLDLNVDGATSLNSTLNVYGYSYFDDDVDVDGATTLNSTLDVSGYSSFYDDLYVDGATSLNSTLDVSGQADFHDDVNVDLVLNVDGATSLNSTLNVYGYSYFDDDVDVDGATSLSSTLDVNGQADFHDDVNVDLDLNVDGATSLNSTLVVDGVTTLNDSLVVGSGANVAATLWADSLSVMDVINGQIGDLSNHDTDVLTEGSSNLYFTNERAIVALSDTIAYLEGLIQELQAASGGAAEFNTCGDVMTYDGYDYATVLIGEQCWFAENLRSTNYNDEAVIPSGLDNAAWSNTTDGAMTIYDEGGANEATNLATYGRLYNWYAVNTGKLCPSGWSVPTHDEWTTLTTYLGGLGAAGSKMKSAAMEDPAWDGTNSSGFSGLPGGSRKSSNGDFNSAGSSGNWWSSSPHASDVSNANSRVLYTDLNIIAQGNYNKRSGFSVRCVLAADATPPTMTIEAAEVMDGGTSPDASLSMTFTASESTSDFDAADITVLNGSISAFTGSGTTYTATFTPDGPGYCAIEVAAGAFSDESQNASIAADQFFWISLDLTPPAISITASEVSDGDSSSDASLTLTFTSSEATTDFTAEDVTVTNGVISSFTGAGSSYSATFTPDADGDCTISIAAGSFNDAAGNGNLESDEFNWTYSSGPTPCDIPTVTYNGHTYGTVLIGGQCWMDENLITSSYSDGTAIPNSWVTNNANAAYGPSDVGYLYNYYVVKSSAGVCPTGWSVADQADWTTLLNFYGGASTAGAFLKSSTDWNGSSTIDYFNAVPSPYKGNNGWEPSSPFNETHFWVANTGNEGTLEANHMKLTSSDAVTSGSSEYNTGFMIRCIRD